jgi:glycosyltransferase involved in cell wall biosynthesis
VRDGGDPIVGLFVGRIDPDQKGLHTLVRAVALLPASPGLEIRLVGEDWGGTERLRTLAQRLGVSDRLTFVGKLSRAELLNEYVQAQFFVLPSIFEPFGIVLLEAMAAGLPVIASRVGGIPEIVEDGRTGLLVEPGNPGALAEALRHLCRDEVLRKSMGRSAREQVMPYDWELIVPRILSVYAEALEGRGG